jgi:hypothetical protein
MRGEWRVLSILPCPPRGEHATPAAMDRTISAWPFSEENFHDPREGIILETAMGVSPFCQAKKPTNPAGSPIPLHPSPPFRQIPRHHRKQVHLQRLLHRPKSDPDHFPVIHPNFRRFVVPARRVFPIHLEQPKSGRVLHRQAQAIPPGFLAFREMGKKLYAFCSLCRSLDMVALKCQQNLTPIGFIPRWPPRYRTVKSTRARAPSLRITM